MAFGVLDPTSWCGCAEAPPQITTRAAQDFCGMAPTVPSSNEESQYFTAGISFRQKRRRSRGLQIKVERSKIETSLEGGASRE